MMARAHVRRAARFALAVPGRYRLPRRSTWHDVRVVNLSDSGILFRAPESLTLGTLFEMIVDIPMQLGNLAPGRFSCVARITRTDPAVEPSAGYPVAAEFVEFRLVDDAGD